MKSRMGMMAGLAGIVALGACAPMRYASIYKGEVLEKRLDRLWEERPVVYGASQMVELQMTEFQSVYAVRVAGKEAPHRHPDNDLTVLVQKGKLSCTLNQSTLDFQAGDSVSIPRNTTYYVVSASTSSATEAIYVFSPPLQAKDQTFTNGTAARSAKPKRRPAGSSH